MKNKFKKFLPTLFRYTIVITIIGVAYIYGTWRPNNIVKNKIIHTVEADVVETAHSFGLHEPSFEYNNDESFISSLKTCIDYINFKTAPRQRIPSAIIISMAGIESAWGTSRFATEGNNLFGIRTWDPDAPQLKPLEVPNARFGVKVYKTKCSSVQDMIDTINNHSAYKDFRKEREKQYDNGDWDYRRLLEKLDAWSTNPKYAGIVFDTIITRQLP
jgi:flagellum-specific peptidoglycan hydrolase FlgJ